jgi:phosphatidylglycerol:prolipoprotein diacylglycerol transferase
MAIAGYLLCGVWGCRTATKRGHDDNDMILLLLLIAAGTLLGGHILYGALNFLIFPQYTSGIFQISGIKDFLARLYSIFGGSVFYGGLIGGFLAGLLCVRKKRLPLPEYTDMLAPAIPFFHIFGRVGCFLGGCCYGVESRFGFIFRQALVAEANGVRRFPVQLAEALGNLLIFLLLAALLKKNALKGRLMASYLLLYSVMRFVLEFWRGDAARGIIYGLSTSQWVSLILFTGIGGYWLLSALRCGTNDKDSG